MCLYPPSQHTVKVILYHFFTFFQARLCSEIRAEYLKISHSLGIHSMACHSRFSFVPQYEHLEIACSKLYEIASYLLSSSPVLSFPFFSDLYSLLFHFHWEGFFSCFSFLSLFLRQHLTSHFPLPAIIAHNSVIFNITNCNFLLLLLYFFSHWYLPLHPWMYRELSDILYSNGLSRCIRHAGVFTAQCFVTASQVWKAIIIPFWQE